VVFSPDGQTLATAYGDCIRFWDVATGKEKATTEGQLGQPFSAALAPIAFSPDGGTLATASIKVTLDKHYLPQIALWKVSDGSLIASGKIEAEVCCPLEFSPDGQVLTGHTSEEQPPACWNVPDITLAAPPVRSAAAISPDQKTCALPGIAGEIILWDLPHGKTIRVIPVQDLVWQNGGVTFSPDLQTLACGISITGYDSLLGRISNGMLGPRRIAINPPINGVKLLDLHTGKVIAAFQGALGGEFSPDGKSWAMHGTDGTIQIWDVPGLPSNWPILLMLWAIGLALAAVVYGWLKRTFWSRRQSASAESSI
jgi:WD40 repeat protein